MTGSPPLSNMPRGLSADFLSIARHHYSVIISDRTSIIYPMQQLECHDGLKADLQAATSRLFVGRLQLPKANIQFLLTIEGYDSAWSLVEDYSVEGNRISRASIEEQLSLKL